MRPRRSGGSADAADALKLRCTGHFFGYGDELSRATFLQTLDPVDCRFYLRLGKVFEASARNLPANRFFWTPYFEDALWLEILLQEGTRISANVWSSEERKTAISGPLIEEMLKADGRSVNAFVTAPFRATEKGWGIARVRDVVLAVADLGKTYAAHRDLLAGYLRQGNGQTRLVAVQNLTRSRTPAEPFVEELVLCATDTSKLLREAAEVLLRRAPEAARPLLEKAACNANRTVRERAVRLLGRLYGGRVSADAGETAGNRKECCRPGGHRQYAQRVGSWIGWARRSIVRACGCRANSPASAGHGGVSQLFAAAI